jgi:hypothetical protein
MGILLEIVDYYIACVEAFIYWLKYGDDDENK